MRNEKSQLCENRLRMNKSFTKRGLWHFKTVYCGHAGWTKPQAQREVQNSKLRRMVAGCFRVHPILGVYLSFATCKESCCSTSPGFPATRLLIFVVHDPPSWKQTSLARRRPPAKGHTLSFLGSFLASHPSKSGLSRISMYAECAGPVPRSSPMRRRPRASAVWSTERSRPSNEVRCAWLARSAAVWRAS